jgi:hypothetical protein
MTDLNITTIFHESINHPEDVRVKMEIAFYWHDLLRVGKLEIEIGIFTLFGCTPIETIAKAITDVSRYEAVKWAIERVEAQKPIFYAMKVES